MSCRNKELVFLILQFLDEEKFKDTVHKLEQESGFFFNIKYFEDEVQNGNWVEVESYLSGFTKVDNNLYSMKMFDEIRKQKDKERQTSQLPTTSSNFRKNDQKLSKYGDDTKSARKIMLVELKKLIHTNPLLREKLQFPNLDKSRLWTLFNQSLNWQHQLCKNPRPNPDVKTLFVDHTCGGQPHGTLAPSPANLGFQVAVPFYDPLLLRSIRRAWGFPPSGAHRPFQPTLTPVPTPMCDWMSNPSTVAHPAVSGGAIRLGGPTNPVVAAMLKHHKTSPTNNHSVDYPLGNSHHVSKQSRPLAISDEKRRKTDDTPKDKENKDSHKSENESEKEEKENENGVSDAPEDEVVEPSESKEKDDDSEEEKGNQKQSSTKTSAKKEALDKAVSNKTATMKNATAISSPKQASKKSSFKQPKVVSRVTTLNVSSRNKKKIERSKRKYSSLSGFATKEKASKEKAGKQVSGAKDKSKDPVPSEDEGTQSPIF